MGSWPRRENAQNNKGQHQGGGMLIFIWIIGYLFTLGVASNMKEDGEAWTIIFFMFAWPFILGIVARKWTND